MTFHRFECIFKVCRICQATDIRSYNVYKFVQIIIIPNIIDVYKRQKWTFAWKYETKSKKVNYLTLKRLSDIHYTPYKQVKGEA